MVCNFDDSALVVPENLLPNGELTVSARELAKVEKFAGLTGGWN
jgi:hypothetical protein